MNTNTRKTWGPLAAITLLILLATPTFAIENGRPDRFHRAVGLLAYETPAELPVGSSGPFGLCSGFVISDRAFVTAAHCIANFAFLAPTWSITLKPGSPKRPVVQPSIIDFLNDPLFFARAAVLVPTAPAMAVHLHPQYVQGVQAFDVAVLEYPPDTFNVRPVRLAAPGTLDRLQRKRLLQHLPVRLAGYGAAEEIVPDVKFSVLGYRQRGFSRVGVLTDQSMILAPDEIFDSRPLIADSGSPQFMLGKAVALTGEIDSQRLDLPEIHEFLQPFID